MSKTKNKATSKTRAVGAAHTGSPSRLKLEVGDRVRIIDIAKYLKDPDYDLKHEEIREMRTAELFRFCIGREFTIRGFDKYGHVEIDASANRSVRKEFGTHHIIWSEAEFLQRVGVTRKKRQLKT